MYEFWYVIPKYSGNATLCYMDTGIKADDIHKEIAENILTRFDTSNYELDRTLLLKKVIGLMKDEFVEKIIIKFVALIAKTQTYLINDGSEDQKATRTKSVS